MNLLTEQDEVNKPPVLTSAAAAVAAAVGGNLAHMQWSQSTENCAHTYLTKMVSHLPSACHKHTTNTDIINSEQKKLKKNIKNDGEKSRSLHGCIFTGCPLSDSTQTHIFANANEE